MLSFTELEVHTMTCTCHAGVRIDRFGLEIISNTTSLGRSPPCVIHSKSPAGVLRGPVKSKKGGLFGYNASFGVLVAEQERAIHVMLFCTGTMKIAGALSEAAAFEAASVVVRACGLVAPPVDLAVHMIKGGLRASRRFDLMTCYHLLRDAEYRVSYDPSRYSALKVSVFLSRLPKRSDSGICRCASSCMTKAPRNRWCHMVTVAIFESGAVGASGGFDVDHLHIAVEKVTAVLRAAPAALLADTASVLERLRSMAMA